MSLSRRPAAESLSDESSHSSAVVGNDIYVIGGLRGINRRNDIWKSGDNGAAWSQVTVNPASSVFSAREKHTSVVQGGALYVIGGGGSGAITLFNDVWKSTDGGRNLDQRAQNQLKTKTQAVGNLWFSTGFRPGGRRGKARFLLYLKAIKVLKNGGIGFI